MGEEPPRERPLRPGALVRGPRRERDRGRDDLHGRHLRRRLRPRALHASSVAQAGCRRGAARRRVRALLGARRAERRARRRRGERHRRVPPLRARRHDARPRLGGVREAAQRVARNVRRGPGRAGPKSNPPGGFRGVRGWLGQRSDAYSIGGTPMILRIDRLQMELPPPSTPDPAGAAVVQELMGGKFGEMSTFMNYTFQSFNFRLRQGARPFYDLVANIAAEEFAHIELVATAINTMLTGAGEKNNLPDPDSLLNPQQIIAGGAAALCQDSNGKPWNGDYITSTGDLLEDLVHNFFLETGARNNKLKVYEMCSHPAARALTGYLLVRGGVHPVPSARARERLPGADMMRLFPSPLIPTDKIRGCRPHIERGPPTRLYRFSPSD